MRSLIIFLLFIFSSLYVSAQVDFKHYNYAIDLTKIPQIEVIARLDGEKLADTKRVLVNLESAGIKKGMSVKRIYDERNNPMRYRHTKDSLWIYFNNIAPGPFSIFVDYYGIPKDGLIITKNKWGASTVFGDNWPNRARHWLALLDHPSEKASVEFLVRVRDTSQCIANGELMNVINIDDTSKIYHWKSKVPLPSKVMVVGATNFAIDTVPYRSNIPLTSWVYPQEAESGFKEYEKAATILEYFELRIAPYPYAKLANVQSTTRYGGMENASCIFYHEGSTKGDGSSEMLIAHEIVHQWFGNSASESDWAHLWLSEGFATYLTEVYRQDQQGDEAFNKSMNRNAAIVFQYFEKDQRPMVDTLETDPNKLLNPNAYQKGAWVLHMLRDSIGDEAFFGGIKNYYRANEFGNADSKELISHFEEAHGEELWSWIAKYLYQQGHPKLKVAWSYKNGKINLSFKQTQKADFGPLYFELCLSRGVDELLIPVRMNTRELELKEKLSFYPMKIGAGDAHRLVELEFRGLN